MRALVRTTTKIVKLNARPLKRKQVALRWVPYTIDTALLHNHVDVKTIVTTTEDMLLCEGIYIAMQVGIVMYNVYGKNMSE
jgi:hypothetical protein